MTDTGQKVETYTHGYTPAVLAQHSARTAGEAAAFLLPRLRPGMSIVDVGCGPGSITVGLAEAVAPGQVTGIDISPELIGKARQAAADRNLANLRFETGSAYALPLPDGSRDVAYMHQVLQHLSKPLDALAEARRVLRPGGTMAVREVDWGTCAWWPAAPAIDRFLTVYREVARRNGGDAFAGRRVRSWLTQAGFTGVECGTAAWTFPGREPPEAWASSWASRITTSNIAEKAVEYGIASRQDLAGIAAGWVDWGRQADAFFTFSHVHGIGVK
jgi:ubiquinone/menaquinone biosynthesis C-methylase UbiE